MENESLDDSLTSIQWLCQLESNKLLKSKSEKRESVTSTPIKRSEENNNPYRKPHFSYASLIVLAINSAADKRMTLQSIYTWIEDNFPYYRFAKKGWKNSIRHNLSLHKFFIKEQRTDVLCGKGSFWRISPEGKENLIRDLLKPPVNNLQPPIALFPHDPNRKLRHILPKPSFDTTGLQYVPVVDYNQLPIMLLPTMNDAGAISQDPISHGQVQTAPLQVQRNYFASPFQETMECNTAKSAAHSTVVAGNLMPRSQNVETVDKYQVCKNEIESCNGPYFKATPVKSRLRTPTQRKSKHSKNNTAIRKSKEVSSRRQRSQVSKNSKRVPNILRKNKTFSVKSPDVEEARIQTPLKNNVHSTLAAINSSNHTPYSPNRRVDDLVNLLNAHESSPPGLNRSFEFLQHGFGSPGISPLRSPACFNSVFSSLGYGECDSGIGITPIKSSLGDTSFNWTPFKTGLTPLSTNKLHSNSNSTQRCRKSLGLEQINETTEYTESNPFAKASDTQGIM